MNQLKFLLTLIPILRILRGCLLGFASEGQKTDLKTFPLFGAKQNERKFIPELGILIPPVL